MKKLFPYFIVAEIWNVVRDGSNEHHINRTNIASEGSDHNRVL